MFLKSLRKKQATPLKYLLRVHILNERYLPCLFKRHLKALRTPVYYLFSVSAQAASHTSPIPRRVAGNQDGTEESTFWRFSPVEKERAALLWHHPKSRERETLGYLESARISASLFSSKYYKHLSIQGKELLISFP